MEIVTSYGARLISMLLWSQQSSVTIIAAYCEDNNHVIYIS